MPEIVRLNLFDRYLLRNLGIAAAVVSVTLVILVFLSQSLKFLELVMGSSASSASFWILTFLALPRFFEIILPLGMMAATIFIYNRMTMDSELVAIRSAGYSPLQLARPALMAAAFVTLVLWSVTFWIAPKSVSNMYHMRQVIKSQFSALLFHEGVFNQVGNGFTVYIHERGDDGELRGIMIYDGRDSHKKPSTILARSGSLVAEGQDHDVVVYDGSRQEYDERTGKLQRLNFERYKVTLPDSEPIKPRWKEPDERTIVELFYPDISNKRDAESLRSFKVEIHRRLNAPLLAFVFTMVCCAGLLTGRHDRRGQIARVAGCIALAVVLQGSFLASFSLARQTDWGVPLMYGLVFVPLAVSYLVLAGKLKIRPYGRGLSGWRRS